jgi:cupin 2 domain-containing protein
MTAGTLLTGIPAALPEELVTILAHGDGVRVERIVSRGHASPPGFWYDQDEHEFVLLVAGAARLHIEGEPERELRPGDWLELAAHVRHRVTWTAPDRDSVWLAVFYRPSH